MKGLQDTFSYLKKILIGLFYSLLLVEAFLQFSFFFNLGLGSNPILFYNPYCDQNYWLTNSHQKQINSNSLEYHPILSLKKKGLLIPENFENKIEGGEIKDSLGKVDSNLIFYGSSFLDHEIFKQKINDKLKNINYAVSSYGLDQIYLSYKLTKDFHRNKLVVIGFLLEDLDRSLFFKRDYEKVKMVKTNGSYKETNTPVDLKFKRKFYDFYSYRLIRNTISLISNDFSPKRSMCFHDYKKELFNFILDDIIKDTKDLNQKLIFISFNFKDDFSLHSTKNWRQVLISDYFSKKDIDFIDSREVIMDYININNLLIGSFFDPSDLHYNADAFDLVIRELEILQSNISER